jgi:hypothetical protein
MATVHIHSGERRSEPRNRIASPALIDEIVEVLQEFGGSGHRDLVIFRVAARRGMAEVTDRLKRDLLNAFDAHCAAAEGSDLLLWLPFGEGSRRWALTTGARQVTDARQQTGMVAATGVEQVAADLVASSALG